MATVTLQPFFMLFSLCGANASSSRISLSSSTFTLKSHSCDFPKTLSSLVKSSVFILVDVSETPGDSLLVALFPGALDDFSCICEKLFFDFARLLIFDFDFSGVSVFSAVCTFSALVSFSTPGNFSILGVNFSSASSLDETCLSNSSRAVSSERLSGCTMDGSDTTAVPCSICLI
uniref:Putative secreted protein n=1 Tax=Panstrongylus lignarius TaxID=156445 RepID=A0A224XZL4_9HEMI